MKNFVLSLFVGCSSWGLVAQNLPSVNQINPEEAFDNISVKKISGDSLSTGFIIWVKDTVRTHMHLEHSEHVYVLEGEGLFYMNDESFTIKTGDLIFIPKKSWHAVKVTSEIPMKVISVQSPAFDGSDRVFKD